MPWNAPNLPFRDLIFSLSFGPSEFSNAYLRGDLIMH